MYKFESIAEFIAFIKAKTNQSNKEIMAEWLRKQIDSGNIVFELPPRMIGWDDDGAEVKN